MFDVFGSVKGLLKLDQVTVDNNIFRLHYKATVVILIAFSLLVTARQYIGDPIDCIVEGVPSNVMDTYCWIHSTFTLPDRLNGEVGVDVPHPGIGPHTDKDEKKYHKYYQWVCFVLFFQALMFYIPRYLWKTWEAGKMKMLVLNLNCPIVAEDTKSCRKKLLIDYFIANLRGHNFYFARFVICEVLNFINVILQIYLVDLFLGNEFSRYGTAVLSFTEEDPERRVDPMAKVFPKVTKCTFHKYGASGTVQRFDGLCVLPLNIVNEKIYVFMWFWFIIVAVLTGLALIYRALIVMSPKARQFLLKNQARLSKQADINLINNKCLPGDWFVLMQLGKNMEPLIYMELIGELSERLQGKTSV
ncbi:innexin inx2-like [Artemia franciscana]|uniref:Innexin n=1 Tax=Artemia franciscana TaxID=6661 RepID=A0AA88KWL5_ARTSF|nr:hypothetical protein QYM36_014632 [Artemia franciscana]